MRDYCELCNRVEDLTPNFICQGCTKKIRDSRHIRRLLIEGRTTVEGIEEFTCLQMDAGFIGLNIISEMRGRKIDVRAVMIPKD